MLWSGFAQLWHQFPSIVRFYFQINLDWAPILPVTPPTDSSAIILTLPSLFPAALEFLTFAHGQVLDDFMDPVQPIMRVIFFSNSALRPASTLWARVFHQKLPKLFSVDHVVLSIPNFDLNVVGGIQVSNSALRSLHQQYVTIVTSKRPAADDGRDSHGSEYISDGGSLDCFRFLFKERNCGFYYSRRYHQYFFEPKLCLDFLTFFSLLFVLYVLKYDWLKTPLGFLFVLYV